MVVGEAADPRPDPHRLAGAQEHGTAGRALNDAMQQALRVGKRAHSETGMDRAGPVAWCRSALDAADRALGVDARPACGR